MNIFLDFNGDGKVDSGESFIGYQIYQDVTKTSKQPQHHTPTRRKLDGFDIFIILLLAFEVLKLISHAIYG